MSATRTLCLAVISGNFWSSFCFVCVWCLCVSRNVCDSPRAWYFRTPRTYEHIVKYLVKWYKADEITCGQQPVVTFIRRMNQYGRHILNLDELTDFAIQSNVSQNVQVYSFENMSVREQVRTSNKTGVMTRRCLRLWNTFVVCLKSCVKVNVICSAFVDSIWPPCRTLNRPCQSQRVRERHVFHSDLLSFFFKLYVVRCTDILVGVQGVALEWMNFMKKGKGMLELAWPQNHWKFFFGGKRKQQLGAVLQVVRGAMIVARLSKAACDCCLLLL